MRAVRRYSRRPAATSPPASPQRDGAEPPRARVRFAAAPDVRSFAADPPAPAATAGSCDELHAHGHSRALLDDVDFLMAGLALSEPLRVRVRSAHRLAKVCRDPETCTIMRAHGVAQRLLAALHAAAPAPPDALDRSLGLAFLAPVFFLLADKDNASLVSSPVLAWLVSLLGADDPLAVPQSAAPAAAAADAPARPGAKNTLAARLFKRAPKRPAPGAASEDRSAKDAQLEALLGDVAPIRSVGMARASVSLLALMALDRLASHACTTVWYQLHAQRALTAISELLLRIVPSLEHADHLAWHLARLAFTVAEYMCLPRENESEERSDLPYEMVSSLVVVVRVSTRQLRATSATLDGRSRQLRLDCLSLAIRVLVNLTNQNPEGTAAFTRHGGLEAGLSVCCLKGSAELFDHTVEGLGLLINAVECSALARRKLAELRLPDDSQSALEFFVHEFDKQTEHQTLEAVGDKPNLEASIVASYLALLVGCMIKDNPALRARVLEAMRPPQTFATYCRILLEFLEFQSGNGMSRADLKQTHDIMTIFQDAEEALHGGPAGS